MNPGKKIYFVLALHNHQPVGNLNEVFEQNFERTYEPFLSVLEKFPKIQMSLHYSGSLLDWLLENQPGFIGRLKKMVERGQVEIMGGAYYEPILPAIPDEDKIGQIRMMSARLHDIFGAAPSGMWLAERVWEPHLARPITQAGIRYLAVDDAHFHDAGYHNLFHYFRTEEEGHALDIFPISEELRYLIPFKAPQETIDFLNDKRDEHSQRLLVLADDGEKFGGWPGTYESVYEKGWLEQFFHLLEEHRDWLKVVTFDEYRRTFPPRGPVYLPTGSYREMKEWSGGFWRNFFSRYPESNRMHKKMLAVRGRLKQLPAGEAFDQAQQYLWAGQCNCAFWHGVFGGLYLNFLRAAVWENLIRAGKIIDDNLEQPPYLRFAAEDRSRDGEIEIAISTDRLELLLAPHLGGSLWELSWRPAAINLLDTLTRRPEAYHREYLEQAALPSPPGEQVPSIHHLKAVKEEGIMEHLRYDFYPRGALIEHFFDEAATLEDFRKGSYQELGDFLMQPATAQLEELPAAERNGRAGLRVTFRRVGLVADEVELLLEKALTIFAGDDQINVDYTLTNRSSRQAKLCFAVEINLALLGGNDEGRYYEIPGRRLQEVHLASSGVEEAVEQVALIDRWRDLACTLSLKQPATLWRAPVETISQSESGLERSYQQSTVLPRWDFTISPGQAKQINLTLELTPAEKASAEQVLVGSEAKS